MIKGLGFRHSGLELKHEPIEASKVRISFNWLGFSTVGMGIKVAHLELLIWEENQSGVVDNRRKVQALIGLGFRELE